MQTPDIPVAVAAITALTGVLKRSHAKTAMQLQTELRLNAEIVSQISVVNCNYMLLNPFYVVANCSAEWCPRVRPTRRSMRAFHAVRDANKQR
jgi:hypothetical protein